MAKIALLGYYGFDNLGDEAILASIISFVKDYPELEITVLSAAPQKTAQSYGVETIDRFSLKEIIKLFSKVDLLLLGGGSLLQDSTSRRSLLYYLALIYLAQKMGLEVILYAQGMGPFKTNLAHYLVPRILKEVSKISVRDRDSKQLLLSLGLEQEVQLTVDPVFNLPHSEFQGPEILASEGLGDGSALLGVAVRYWPPASGYLEKLARALERIKEELQLSICLIPFQEPSDLEASYELQSKLRVESKVIKGSYGPLEMGALIAELELLIGVRLHSLLLAALKGVPLFGISYDPKVDSFLDSLGLGARAQIDNLSVDDLFKQILNVWQVRAQLSLDLAEQVSKLQVESRRGLEWAVEDLIKGSG